MTERRSGAAAAMLLDGRPFVVGGSNKAGGSHSLATTEIFDPPAGSWLVGGLLTTARQFHTATTLESGKVLTAGGANVVAPPGTGAGFLKSAELYDPATNMWTSAGDMGANQERQWHTATLLGNGKAWVAGGYGPASQDALKSTRLFTLGGAWTQGPDLTTGRFEHTATLLANGKVLIAGGRINGLLPDEVKDAELYSPHSTPGAQISSGGAMSVGRTFHTATLLQDGRVLVAGGTDGTNALKSAELYNPSTNSWSPAGDLPGPREGHTATLLRDGRVLVTGGDDGNANAIKTTALYNPVTNKWSLGPSMTTPRNGHTATGLLSGRVLAAAGVDAAAADLKSAELFSAVPPSRDARRPIVAYIDNGKFGLFDSETQKDVTPPRIPSGVARFGISQNGRYVVYLHPVTKHIHLYDRYVHHELGLPGIDASDHGNPTMSVSDTGLIAFDHDTSDTTQVYDAVHKHFIDTGLPADNHHRQPSISGDGRYLATTCLDHCVVDPVDGDDAYLQDLKTRQNVPIPDDLGGAGGGEEHPCINHDGSLVGFDVMQLTTDFTYLYSRAGDNTLPVPNDPAVKNVHCALDRSGQHIAIENFTNGTDRLYDRLTSALVPLPSKIHDVVALSDPVLQPPNTRITRVSVKQKKRTAKFSFAGVGPTAGFQCELIRPKRKHHKPPPAAKFTSCRSPKLYKHLAIGKYTFKVRAFNAAGIDATPAQRTFTIKKPKKKK